MLSALRWSFGIVLLLFVDSVRQVYVKNEALHPAEGQRYEPGVARGLESKLYDQSGKFRAERNMYLAGFVLVLGLVVNRLVLLIGNSVSLEVRMQALSRQSEQQQQQLDNPVLLKVLLERAEAKADGAAASGEAAGLNDLPSPPAPDTKDQDPN